MVLVVGFRGLGLWIRNFSMYRAQTLNPRPWCFGVAGGRRLSVQRRLSLHAARLETSSSGLRGLRFGVSGCEGLAFRVEGLGLRV